MEIVVVVTRGGGWRRGRREEGDGGSPEWTTRYGDTNRGKRQLGGWRGECIDAEESRWMREGEGVGGERSRSLDGGRGKRLYQGL